MDNKFIAQWETYAKSALDHGKELETLNVKLIEKLVQKQLDLLGQAVEASNKLFGMIGDAKALPEIFAEQSRFASDYGNKLAAATKETADIMVASREDYRAWFEKGFKAFTDQSQAVAAAAVTPKAAARKAA